MISRLSLFISIVSIFVLSFFYYPKYQKSETEATISWDVSGYYIYLPAFFIHNDPLNCSFYPEILRKYKPTPDFQQAFKAPNGNYVFKYSIGHSLLMSPGFVLGHVLAKIEGHPQDGYSKPYQFGIHIWSFLVTCLGLYLLLILLRRHFDETTTAITILCISLATNYLEYSAITNSMTHNYLFALYCGLLLVTERFYQRHKWQDALLIGVIIGLMALTRPTEIIAVILPLFWGFRFSSHWLRSRLIFFKAHFSKILIAIAVTGSIGFIQLAYWKYASGEWIVYSYEKQGFSWLRPHLWDGFLSGRAGWLTYTPIMGLALAGFLELFKSKKDLFWVFLGFTVLFVYVTFAWDIWWYGGSVGQRALIQIYPVLSFPLAALITTLTSKRIGNMLISILLGLCFIYNVWLTHQAHKGGLFLAGEMTIAYLKEVIFDKSRSDEAIKLLDTKHIYTQTLQDSILLEMKTSDTTRFCLRDTVQFSPSIAFVTLSQNGWLRVSADYVVNSQEWESWRMTQLIVRLYSRGKEQNAEMIRIQRHLQPNLKKSVHIDLPISSMVDSISVTHWHADGRTQLCFDNIKATFHKGIE